MKELQPKLNLDDKDLMEKLLTAGNIKHKYAVRLQTILLRTKGKGTNEISDFLGIHLCTVSLYINRYNELGIDALLKDRTRKPGTEPISQELLDKVIRIACNEKPKNETHWSSRSKRFVMYFTPTHSSWLNIVERRFAEITNKRIRRGNFESVKEWTLPQPVYKVKQLSLNNNH